MGKRVSSVLINAATARMGGGLAFAEEVVPRVRCALEKDGVAVSMADGGGFIGTQARGLLGGQATVVFNVANTSIVGTRAPQLVAVRDRILVEPRDSVPGAESRRTAARRLALDVALRQCEVAVVPTEAMRQPLIGFAARRRIAVPEVEVVAHGAPASWEPAPMPPLPPLRILHPSYGAAQKNIPLLIRAVGLLPDELMPALTLTVDEGIGGGEFAECAARWAPGRVRFAGRVSRQELPALYADHHLLAFPSSVESLGIPLLEAMSAGRRIVASDTDWARETCGPHATYAPLGDAAAWRDAIVSLVEADSLTGTPTPATAWLARFSWDHAAARYTDLLRQLL